MLLVKSLGAKLLGQQLAPLDSAAECSYITPNILAIGKMTEDNAEHALMHLHGYRYLAWNLTGSPIPPGIQQKMLHQVINIPWEKFTFNIPTIVDMLNLCYALSSWLSFDVQNVAIFYYGDLTPLRPGVLFACYQKYVNGELVRTFEAFMQYCHDHNIQLPEDAIPESLRKFFDNFDQVVSNGGFPNTAPHLLRSIVVQGLPVDEMPLLEVRECSSSSTETYLSHDQDGTASWTGEAGSFVFNKYICGEFLIACYFGGEHFWRPNNSTLIFKFHDNTGLLPAEPVRILKHQVDIPVKEHREIIDAEHFVVDIYFEQPFDIEAAGPKRLPKDVLCGYEAFVGGVACLSGWHAQEVAISQLEELAAAGFETNIANLSLQVANNNLEMAMVVAKQLREYQHVLRKQGLVKRRGSDIIKVSAAPAPAIGDAGGMSPLSSASLSPRISPRLQRAQSFASRSNSSSNSTSKSSTGRKRALTDAQCAICSSDDILKRPQLIVCFQCRRHYHTYCAGEAAIPFKLSTATERQHHANYVKSRFKNWRCPVCVSSEDSIVADHFGEGVVAGSGEGVSSRTASTSSASSSPVSEVDRAASDTSRHPDGSSEIGTFRGSGRSLESSPRAGALDSSKRGISRDNGRVGAGGAVGGTVGSGTGDANGVEQGTAVGGDHADLLEAVLSPRFDRQRASSHAGISSGLPFMSTLARQQGSFTDSPDIEIARQIIPHLKQLQRIGSVEELLQQPEALAQLLQVVGQKGRGFVLPAQGQAASNADDGDSAGVGGVPLKEHPVYGKYFKMMKVGLPLDTVKHKLRMEHPEADPSLLEQNGDACVSIGGAKGPGNGGGIGGGNGGGIGGGNGGGIGGGNGGGIGGGAAQPSDKVMLKDHPVYGKYFKMLKVGLPVEAAKQKLRIEHPDADSSMLDQPPDTLVDVNIAGASGGSPTPVDDEVVALKDHPVYGKYVKMMKVGLPLEAVKQKFRMEHPNADASILEQGPDAQVPVTLPSRSAPSAAPTAAQTEEQVALKDHPVYGKYFKMLKVGLPKGAVQQKLLSENPGADASMLDKDPESMVPVAIPSAVPTPSPSEQQVALKDHPMYGKYIKMLKVGLPKGAVQQKLLSENPGADPSMLDRDPESMVPVQAATATAAPAPSAQQVALKDHPMYGKFFKMMKVGMPKELVKQKMAAEFPDADSSMLDESPDKLVAVNAASKQSQAQKTALKDHSIYGKFFKMLKVGIPKEAVKKKLLAEHPTADASMMDQDPELLVEEKPKGMVAAQDHPLYQKYFKMLKVGLPPAAVKAKMALEGLDQSVIDKPPDTMIPLEADADQPKAVAKAEPPKPKVRRRKLHWKPIPADRLNDADSIWAGVNENTNAVHIDLDEFEKLFVARDTPGAAEAKPKKPAVQKVQRVTLIEGKRAQNCAIALARIKMAYSDMAERIKVMEDRYFTGDQLTSLLEFIPNQDDAQALKSYTGDPALLGEAEKFMLEMLNVPRAKDLIAGMAYMQQFGARVTELKRQMAVIDNACDDVKLSMKLRKVLAVVLKLGNFMNQEQELSGFTLDSLLKLRTVKGFDQKTSMLHYLVRLVKVNDEAALDFKADLTHVPAASRVVLDSLVAEKAALRQGFEQVQRTAKEALGLSMDADATSKRDLMQDFEQEHTSPDTPDSTEQQTKASKQERIEQIRHRRTQTRVSKLAHGQQVVHFDAAEEVRPATPSEQRRHAKQESDPDEQQEGQEQQQLERGEHGEAEPKQPEVKEDDEQQQQQQDKDEQKQQQVNQSGADQKAAPETPKAVATPNVTRSAPSRRRSSVRSDKTGPLTENNVLDFIYKASSRLEELDKTIDALVQKFQSVLSFFGEDPKMQSHEFFNTLSAFVAAFSEAHEQVQRIEKSKERQRKQEEALEQRKLSRRASQPVMKISGTGKSKAKEPTSNAADEGNTGNPVSDKLEKPTENTSAAAAPNSVPTDNVAADSAVAESTARENVVAKTPGDANRDASGAAATSSTSVGNAPANQPVSNDATTNRTAQPDTSSDSGSEESVHSMDSNNANLEENKQPSQLQHPPQEQQLHQQQQPQEGESPEQDQDQSQRGASTADGEAQKQSAAEPRNEAHEHAA